MFCPDEELIEEDDASNPLNLVMTFILTPLLVSRRVKRSAALVRQKLGTGVRRTMSKSIRGLSSTAKRIARMKHFVKKPRNLLKKPKAPSKISIYKLLPLRLISRVMGWISRLYLPVWLRPLIFYFYIKIFSCNPHEMYNEDLKSYCTISEFFRRKIKMELRPIDKQSPIVSTCDGHVLTCGKVSRGLIEQVKGITYTASSFLGVPLTAGLMKFQQQNKTRSNSNYDYDDAHSYAESLLRYRSHALYYAVIYLAPGDYHRFHSPTEWQISWRCHYIGHLFSVNPKVANWLQNLFCLNERAAYYDKPFQTIRNSNEILLKRADNFGDFNFGSTVVLVFEAPDNLVFNVKPGDPIKLGQSLCDFDRQNDIDVQDIKQDGNTSSTLSTEETQSSNEEDENLMSKSIRGLSSTAKRIARMKHFVKKPRNLLKKPKAPSKISIYKLLPLRLISRLMGWISRLYLPVWLRPLIFYFYIKIFSCNPHEMYNEDLKSYCTISEFFRRKIKMELRPIDKQSPIVSPCDGRVLTCGKVSRGLIEQVKGITYTASSFLGVPLTAGLTKFQQQNKTRSNSTYDYDDAHSYAESLLRYRGHALYYAVIYLAPGDYHRFHSPTEWQINWRRHYIGHLFSVNPKVASWLQNLFCLNERAAYYGSWKYGFFSMTAVGATIVGSINVHFDPELKTNIRRRPRLEKTFQTIRNSNGILLKRADNFGDFNFGSTVVLVFEAPDNLVFNVKPGDPIKLGQSLCDLDRQNDIDVQDIKQRGNTSSTLSTEETQSSNEEDENLNVENEEQNIDRELLIDTVALDAAIVDADAIANADVITDQEGKSNTTDE
ncbi:unnamed protein product [Rotaria sordida]|uniref:Phosphatidylserine decarboxylase proenzyme, mitochondrial n=2 Tax=Rotaria sordida TaxID=392033 RepID=A0A814MD83_9BILA|nr:unnamed protein product [Rotaria sordida]